MAPASLLAVLSVNVQPVTVRLVKDAGIPLVLLLMIAPPNVPVLLVKLQFEMTAEELLLLLIAPPLAPATFRLNAQLVRVSVIAAAPALKMAPPRLDALLEVKMQLPITGDEDEMFSAPAWVRRMLFPPTVSVPAPLALPRVTVKPSSTVPVTPEAMSTW